MQGARIDGRNYGVKIIMLNLSVVFIIIKYTYTERGNPGWDTGIHMAMGTRMAITITAIKRPFFYLLY
jgi:hypothetical protein